MDEIDWILDHKTQTFFEEFVGKYFAGKFGETLISPRND